jgi:hypothetical protein
MSKNKFICTQLTRPSASEGESTLYDLIFNKIAKGNKERADELYAYFDTTDFIEDFGEWQKDYAERKKAEEDKTHKYNPRINQKYINAQGEPRLEFNKNKGQFYYTNKEGRVRYFPDQEKGLEKEFENLEILNIANTLALNYIKHHTGIDFKSLDLTAVYELLSNSVKSQLKQYAKAQYEAENYDLAEKLEESADYYLEEWVLRVKDVFKSNKLIYKEVLGEVEEAEQTRSQQAYGAASFESSTKDNISTNVKLRLSILQDMPDPDSGYEGTVDDTLGEPVFIPFNAVYGVLLGALNNKVAVNKNGTTENLFDMFISEIEKLSFRKPYLNSLLKELKHPDLDPNIKYEFTQAFNLHKNNFISTDVINQGDKGVTFNILDITNAGSKFKNVLSTWNDSFRDKFAPRTKFKKGSTGYKNMEVLHNGLKKLAIGKKDPVTGKVVSAFKDKIKNKGYKTDADLAPVINTVATYFNRLGIDVTEKGMDFYLDNLEMKPRTVAERVDKLAETIDAMYYFTQRVLKRDLKITEGVALGDQEIFNEIAKAEAFFMHDETDSTVYSAGKTKWLFSNPSYLSTTVLMYKKNPELLELILEDTYGASSLYANYLLAKDKHPRDRERFSLQRLNDFNVTTFNTLKEKDDAEAVDNTSISINDFTADLINKSHQDIPYYYTPTPADKGNHHMIKIGKKIFTNAVYKDKMYLLSEAKGNNAYEIFLNYFKSEYARIAEVQAQIDEAGADTSKLRVHYHVNVKGGIPNGLKSQLFPSLSPENWAETKERLGLKFDLYDESGRPLLDDLENLRASSKDPHPLIESFIKPMLSQHIENALNDSYKKGIFQRNEKGETIANGVDSKIVDKYKGLTGDKNITASEKQFPLKIIADTLINGMISQIEYAKLFSGDVAYYKNPVDYKKRIPATYTDGLALTLNPGEEFFNIAAVQGVEIATPYLDKLKKMLPSRTWKHYAKGINSTDAQAWITPQRWKFLMIRLGKWSPKHDEVYKKMMFEENPTYTEKELKLAAQPVKGVYFDKNNQVPIYLKYSQAVLIPSLIKDTPLEKMYDKMIEGTEGKDSEENLDDYNKQTHEVITIDGIKVGSLNPTPTHNADGTMLEDFNLVQDSITNAGWKLQQDLPTKTFKDTGLGSQLQKNIFAGLASNLEEHFDVNGEVMTGKELYQFLNRIVKQLTDKGKGILSTEFGIVNGKIGNYEAVNNALIEELKSRGGNRDVIKALENNLTPYAIPQAKDTLSNVFASMFTNKLVKIKTNGGSFIQLSNYGLSKPQAESKGVIWSPALEAGETAFEPHYLEDSEGNIIYRGKEANVKKYKEQIEELKEKASKNVKVGDKIKVNFPNQKPATMEVANIEFRDKGVVFVELATKNGKKNYPYLINSKGEVLGKDSMSLEGNFYDEAYTNRKLEQLNKSLENEKALLKEPIIRPGGVLLSGSFIAKHIPNYKDFSALELFGKYNADTGKYEAYTNSKGELVQPMIDNDILQGLIGYRIPNQGLASNDSLQIVGILPEAGGDTVVAYTGITTKTGSDFDIDKMYLMMPSFIPVRPMKSKFRTYLLDTYKGTSKPEILNKLAEITKNSEVTFDFNKLADLLLENKTAKKLDSTTKRAFNKEIGKLVEALQEVDDVNMAGKKLLTIAEHDPVTRLMYAAPNKDKNGIPLDRQDTEQLNNLLIQGYKAVLTHNKVIDNVMTPIDFDFMKDDITALHQKDAATDLEDFNPFADITLKYEFLAGQAGVGQEANALVDHNRGRMATTYFKNLYLGRGNATMQGSKAVTKLDDEFSETLNPTDIKLYREAYNSLQKNEKDHISEEQAKELATIRIADSLSAVLNGFVDIAKDPFITRGNWTTQTTNTGNMLLRAGFHPFYVNAILGQPMIKEYVAYVTNKESKIVKDTGDLKDKFRIDMVNTNLIQLEKEFTIGKKTKTLQSIYKSVARNLNDTKKIDYKASYERLATIFGVKVDDSNRDLIGEIHNTIVREHNRVFHPSEIKVEDLNLAKYREQIMNGGTAEVQMAVLNAFFGWQEQSKQLRQSVLGSKVDVDGYGKNVGSLVTTKNIIGKLLKDNPQDNDFVGYREKLKQDGVPTLLGAYTNNIIFWVDEIMQANPRLFFEAQDQITNTANAISLDIKDDILTDEKLADKIYREYYNYLMSGFKPFMTSPAKKAYLLKNDEDSFITLFKEYKEATEEGVNPLLDELYIKRGEDGRSFIAMSNRKRDADHEYKITAAWEDMLNRQETGEDEDIDELVRESREFAEDLIKYAYLTSGFKKNIGQFFTYIPSSWFIKNRVDNYLDEAGKKVGQHKNSEAIDPYFLDQFYRNLSDDGQAVPNLLPNMVKPLKIGDTVYPGVVITNDAGRQRRFVKITTKSDQMDVFGKYPKTTKYYKLAGYDQQFNGIYVQTTPLSSRDKYGNYITEYQFGEHIEKSIMRTNKIAYNGISEETIKTINKIKAFKVTEFDRIVSTGTIDLRDDVMDELNCEI